MFNLKKTKPMSSKTVFIGIGTNKGDREENITLALKLLSSSSQIKLIKISKLLRNPPQEGIKTGYFLNGAIKIKTNLSPNELLLSCKKIEKKLGRNIRKNYHLNKKLNQHTSRVIDLDILLYENRIINTETLTIPHPMIHKRYFVLIPLIELGGNILHPILKKTIFKLYQEYNSKTEKSA